MKQSEQELKNYIKRIKLEILLNFPERDIEEKSSINLKSNKNEKINY